jgi:hypothetical protein
MRAGIDENVPIPKVGMKFVERVVGPVKDCRVHMGGAKQAAVQPVSPAVVGALNSSGEITLGGGTQARATVPADVIESFYGAGVTANDDNTLAGNLAQEIIACTGNAVGAACADPTLEKELLDFLTEERGVCIVARRQCFRNGGQTLLLVLGIL